MYKQIIDKVLNKEFGVRRLSDNAFIPFDPDNTDYQKYLKWLEEGNQPEPADQS
jgi:hypothetical protein